MVGADADKIHGSVYTFGLHLLGDIHTRITNPDTLTLWINGGDFTTLVCEIMLLSKAFPYL